MILPHISYCLIVWGKCVKSLVDRIFILQKRAIRIITNSHFLSHTDKLFKKLNILKIQDLYSFQVACFMYKYSKNLLPPLFDDYFILNRCINSYETRNSDKFYIPFYRYKLSRSTIRFIGPKIWNSTNTSFKLISSFSSFKKKYKFQLINEYNTS